MKRTLYIPILILLAACSNDDVVDVSNIDTNEIKLNVTVNNTTIATSRTTYDGGADYIQTNFTLFATKCSDNSTYLDQETMRYTGKGADLAQFSFEGITRYWPVADKLNFFAVSNSAGCSFDSSFGESAFLTSVDDHAVVKVDKVKIFTDYQADTYLSGARELSSIQMKSAKELYCFDNLWSIADVKTAYFASRGITITDSYKGTTELAYYYFISDRTRVNGVYVVDDMLNFLKERNNIADIDSAVEDYIQNVYLKNSSTDSAHAPMVNFESSLLYAVVNNVAKEDNNGYVNLNFRHALSKINFIVETSNPHIFMDIPENGVSIAGFKNYGYLTFGTQETKDNYGDNTQAYNYSNGCTWTIYDEAANTAANEYMTFITGRQPVLGSYYSRENIIGHNSDYVTVHDDHIKINLYPTSLGLSSKKENSKLPPMLIPYPYEKGSCNGSQRDGLFLKIRCYICNISDTEGFQDFLKNNICFDKYISLRSDKTPYISFGSGASKEKRDEAFNLVRGAILTGVKTQDMKYVSGEDTELEALDTYTTYGPYGALLFGGRNISSYAAIEDADYKDLYIPLNEIVDSTGKNIGWEPGKAYTYCLKFDFTGDGNTIYDEDGNPVLNMTVKASVLSIDDWGTGKSTSL